MDIFVNYSIYPLIVDLDKKEFSIKFYQQLPKKEKTKPKT
jgi:hypothetical protein